MARLQRFALGLSIAASVVAANAFARGAPSLPKPPVEIHYAPVENLENIDVRVLNDAERSIDMAAYVLTDGRVIEALCDAADRGVTVRVYLDKTQYSEHGPRQGDKLSELLAYPNVFVRIKGRGVLMHLKAYSIDGSVLRTGSGNFSVSGLEKQDNDLVLLSDKAAVTEFERNFSAIWARGQNLDAVTGRETGIAKFSARER